MAKPPIPASPDDIMKVAAIKAVLRQVKSEGGKEVSCAVCLPDGDKSEAVILLDRIMAPKDVRKHLLKDAKAVGLALDEMSLRFGIATMDPADETVLLLKVNRPPAGEALGRAVRKRVKSAFKDVVFTVDAALEQEQSGEAATAEAPPTVPEALAGPAPAARPADLSALSTRLARLIGAIPAAAASNPALAAELKALATEANAHIKVGDANGAGDVIDTLTTRLRQGAPGGGAAAPAPSFVTMQKSRLLWQAARTRVLSEVASLKSGIADSLTHTEHAAAIARAHSELDEIPEKLDDRLTDVLDQLLNEQDPARRDPLLAQARQILGEYASFVASNPLIPKLNGGTPFGVALTISATCASTLKAMQASLH